MSYFVPQACMTLGITLEDFRNIKDTIPVPATATLSTDFSKPSPNIIKIQVVPREVSVEVGDYRTADKFSCTLDYRSFPFDPRIIRACAVTVHMENMKSVYKQDGSLNTIVPKASNTVFQGFVDQDEISFSDNERKVHFEGRDLTALLIDPKYSGGALDLDQPLNVLIKNFLSKVPALKDITLVDRSLTPITTDLPTPGKFMAGANDKLGTHKNTGVHNSYWELIQDACQRCGLICYMHLDKLVITTSRDNDDKTKDFKVFYGKNISSLGMKRKLGRLKNFNVVVRSVVGKEVISATIPREATQTWCDSIGIAKADVYVPALTTKGELDTAPTQLAPTYAFPISKEVSDKDSLITIGESVYEEYSRQQLEGEFETNEMIGFSSGNPKDHKSWVPFDLTQLDIGHPLSIEIGTDDLLAISRTASAAERTTYLTRKGYTQSVASLIADTIGKTSPRFFTKNFTLSFSENKGFNLKVNFINLILLPKDLQ